uniref:Transcription factor n=1 Tax=Lampea lactea TaxID=1403706 RepID=V9PPY6_9METZ|nr:transcription factor [Lampea lactea]
MVFECIFTNCGHRFDKQWKLDAHICFHTGERPFICEEPGCDKSFIRKTHLQRHALSHSEARPHICSTCKSSFKILSNLRKHERTHAGKKPYSCTECEAAFLKKTQLYAHLMTTHDKPTPFQCDVCDKSFTNQVHLSRHKRKHFSRFMCTDCLEVFDKFSVLQKHISREHKKKHVCDVCNTTFSSLSNLNSHVRTVHMTPDSGTFSELGTSSQLSVEFTTKTELYISTEAEYYSKTETKHNDSETETENNEIESDSGTTGNDKTSDTGLDNEAKCNSLAADEGISIPDEMVSIPSQAFTDGHLSKPTFSCSTCHKTYLGKSQLTRHRKTVHNIVDVTEYKCTFENCSAVFRHKHNYLKHIKSKHEGIKQFQCLQCPAQFFYKQSFERHVLAMHNTERKERKKRTVWNKLSLNEELSGHIKDERVKRYIDDMKQMNRSDI